jgi:glutathione S-transferase
MELIIGTKKWSSWSLRAWLPLARTGVPFTETVVELYPERRQPDILRHSPTGYVPALDDDGLLISDSLAICEYLAERFPAALLSPSDTAARALGRSAAAEMHSGFAALRKQCPMDLTRSTSLQLSPETESDVRRIVELWRGLLERFGGPFLVGGWSIADAFFTPVATRFRTYGIDLAAHGDDGAAARYAQALLRTPEYLAWEAAARAEDG